MYMWRCKGCFIRSYVDDSDLWTVRKRNFLHLIGINNLKS